MSMKKIVTELERLEEANHEITKALQQLIWDIKNENGKKQ